LRQARHAAAKERIMRTTGFRLVAIAAMLGIAGLPCPAAAQVKTSKERLSDKASDEQRIDNCRVPVERRGPVARPACADDARSQDPRAGSADSPSRH
jgi:hypothetical protein